MSIISAISIFPDMDLEKLKYGSLTCIIKTSCFWGTWSPHTRRFSRWVQQYMPGVPFQHICKLQMEQDLTLQISVSEVLRETMLWIFKENRTTSLCSKAEEYSHASSSLPTAKLGQKAYCPQRNAAMHTEEPATWQPARLSHALAVLRTASSLGRHHTCFCRQ